MKKEGPALRGAEPVMKDQKHFPHYRITKGFARAHPLFANAEAARRLDAVTLKPNPNHKDQTK